MYVIPLYPQPVFHSNPNIHSSFLCGFLVPSPPSPPIPSHFSHLIPLIEFSQRPKAKRFSPAGTTWPPNSSARHHRGRGPSCSGGHALWRSLTQMFSVGTFVFSLQTELILRAAPSLETLYLTKFTQLLFSFSFFFLFSFTVSSAVEIPPEHGACISRGNSRVNSGFQLGLLFLRARGLNAVWGDMLLKCKFSRSCRLGSEFDWKQRSWTPRCYLEVEI